MSEREENSRENLQKLEELTERLTFSQLVKSIHTNYIELRTENGNLQCFGVYKDEKIAVMRCFASTNTTMIWHIHESAVEYGLVYDGEMRVYFEDGKEVIVKKGEQVKIDMGVSHMVKWPIDTWFLAATIPPQKEFVGIVD